MGPQETFLGQGKGVCEWANSSILNSLQRAVWTERRPREGSSVAQGGWEFSQTLRQGVSGCENV